MSTPPHTKKCTPELGIMSSYVLSQVEMFLIWILKYSSLIVFVFVYLVDMRTYVQ